MMKYIFILLPLWVNAQHFEFEAWTSKQGPQFASAGVVVGMTKGSWIDYPAVPSGAYILSIRYATTQNSVRMQVSRDTIPLPNTGAWSKFETVTKTLFLSGTTRFILVSDASMNLDWFEIRKDTSFVEVPPVFPYKMDCIAIMYRSGTLALIKDSKYLMALKDTAGKLYYTDDKGVKLNIILYQHPNGQWLGL